MNTFAQAHLGAIQTLIHFFGKSFTPDQLWFFVQGIPEMTGVIAVCCVLARTSVRWSNAIILGIILCLTIFVIRASGVLWGVHTLAAMLIIILYLIRFHQVSSLNALLSTISGWVILLASEYAFGLVIYRVLQIDPNTASLDAFRWAMIGMPQAIFFLILGIFSPQIIKPKENLTHEHQS
ncbi:MAG: hypothetical protein ACM3QZ_00025 [Solirubrobacterales bacterium]